MISRLFMGRSSPASVTSLLATAALACLAAALTLSGCGGAQADAGPSSRTSTTQVQLYAVDGSLSSAAQAGSLAQGDIPPGKAVYNQLERDASGQLQRNYYGEILTVPWVVDAEPLLDAGQVTAVSNPGSGPDGRPQVTVGFSPEAAARLRSESRAGRNMAIVTGIEVRAVVPVGASADNGVSFSCSASEAATITGLFRGTG